MDPMGYGNYEKNMIFIPMTLTLIRISCAAKSAFFVCLAWFFVEALMVVGPVAALMGCPSGSLRERH